MKASSQEILRIEPPNWWTGMEETNLQLIVYGKKIAKAEPAINYNGVKILKISQLENSNYLFIDLQINKSTEPGILKIDFKLGKKHLSYDYELKQKEVNAEKHKGFDSSDVI